MINVYCSGQRKNVMVATAFAQGLGVDILPPYPLQPGDVFMYGCLRGLLPTLRQAQAEGRNWYYADNGYFKPARKGQNGYFRVTRNAMQHDGTGAYGPKRWRQLEMTIAPWRKTGKHIIVCPPARLMAVIKRFDADAWLVDMKRSLRDLTDRPIRMRKKMSHAEVKQGMGCPLSEDLRGAWALITHSSNAAVEALLAGVPVFCTDPCAAYRMGSPDVTLIETPLLPEDREQWAWNLAANQWSPDEMRNGVCWKQLNE